MMINDFQIYIFKMTKERMLTVNLRKSSFKKLVNKLIHELLQRTLTIFLYHDEFCLKMAIKIEDIL